MMRRMTLGAPLMLFTFAVGTLITLWINHSPPPSPVAEQKAYFATPVVSTPKTLTDDRDLSLYDLGGHQGCGNVLLREVPRCRASIQKARAFIWKHWQEKKRGYVVVKMASTDAESDSHIFIETDANGWHVVWKCERIFGISMREDVSGRIDQIPDIRSIERVIESQGGRFAGDSPNLLFFDANGKEIARL